MPDRLRVGNRSNVEQDRAFDAHEPSSIERLQQVVRCADLERLQGVLIERRNEDDQRSRAAIQAPRELHPGHLAHLDIEKIGSKLCDRGERGFSVHILTNHFEITFRSTAIAQQSPRGGLIVDDHHLHY
jgi:hypothetical protein